MEKKSKCNRCRHNPQGVCLLTGKEIGVCYVINKIRTAPKWCPLEKKKKEATK